MKWQSVLEHVNFVSQYPLRNRTVSGLIGFVSQYSLSNSTVLGLHCHSSKADDRNKFNKQMKKKLCEKKIRYLCQEDFPIVSHPGTHPIP